eukprot:3280082-Lingulodinium_polyedra.AAC.1
MGLAAVNTWWGPWAPAYFSNPVEKGRGMVTQSKKQIDFIWVPFELLQSVTWAGVAWRSARRLQLIKDSRYRDHAPVMAVLHLQWGA